MEANAWAHLVKIGTAWAKLGQTELQEFTVLQACDIASIKHLLEKLPAVRYPLALQARYPSITTHHSLELTPLYLVPPMERNPVLSSLLQADSSFTALRSLSVGHVWHISTSRIEAHHASQWAIRAPPGGVLLELSTPSRSLIFQRLQLPSESNSFVSPS